MKKPIPATILCCTVSLLLLFAASCGKPQSMDNGEGLTPVLGKAFFGTQCPYGSFSDPVPAKLELWNCPTGLQWVEVTQPFQPMILQADCKKKTISARAFDRTTDSFWEMMPDGSFEFSTEGGVAKIADDGHGKPCTAALSAYVTGQVDCSGDRDKVKIVIDTVWNLKKDSTAATVLGSDAMCKLPQSCYFHSSAHVQQCQ